MKINGKNYNLGEITFKTICDLENMGISVSNMMDKPMNTILAFATLATGDKQIAERELNEHFINGGDLNSIVQSFQEAMTESGFMKALLANKEESKAPAKKSTVKKAEN
ncbi:MAG: hypothetical protein UH239_09995 [Acutalibacteraceae bacterium]|nr:hypothetical protein [Acutalibacteraceae bacterium]